MPRKISHFNPLSGLMERTNHFLDASGRKPKIRAGNKSVRMWLRYGKHSVSKQSSHISEGRWSNDTQEIIIPDMSRNVSRPSRSPTNSGNETLSCAGIPMARTLANAQW